MDDLVDVKKCTNGLRGGNDLGRDRGLLLTGEGGEFEEVKTVRKDICYKGGLGQINSEFSDEFGLAIIKLISQVIFFHILLDHFTIMLNSLINNNRRNLFSIGNKYLLRQMFNQLNEFLFGLNRND